MGLSVDRSQETRKGQMVGIRRCEEINRADVTARAGAILGFEQCRQERVGEGEEQNRSGGPTKTVCVKMP